MTLVLVVLMLVDVANACEYFKPESAVRACQLVSAPFEGRLQDSRVSIVSVLGTPVSATRSSQPNPYDEKQIDVSEHFVYPQTEFWVTFLAGNPHRAFPTGLKTRDPKLTMRFGIRVGMATAMLVEILGKPYQRTPVRWSYGSESGDIYFEISSDRVASITWAPYLG